MNDLLTQTFDQPVWSSGNCPPVQLSAHKEFLGLLSSSPELWRYWRKWYQGIWDGRPLDWELQSRIAELHSHSWAIDAAEYAKLVSEAESRFELERRIFVLERAIGQSIADRHGIGGNYPPEPIDEYQSLVLQVSTALKTLENLKTEIKKDTPDRDVVNRIVEILHGAAVSIFLWIGQKGDLAVDTLIKWGVPIGTATLLAKPELLEPVIDAARNWLSWL